MKEMLKIKHHHLVMIFGIRESSFNFKVVMVFVMILCKVLKKFYVLKWELDTDIREIDEHFGNKNVALIQKNGQISIKLFAGILKELETKNVQNPV